MCIGHSHMNGTNELTCVCGWQVDEYWKKYPFLSACRSGASEDAESRRNRKEMEENLLILFRRHPLFISPCFLMWRWSPDCSMV